MNGPSRERSLKEIVDRLPVCTTNGKRHRAYEEFHALRRDARHARELVAWICKELIHVSYQARSQLDHEPLHGMAIRPANNLPVQPIQQQIERLRGGTPPHLRRQLVAVTEHLSQLVKRLESLS
jgi:hypothetical protein